MILKMGRAYQFRRYSLPEVEVVDTLAVVVRTVTIVGSVTEYKHNKPDTNLRYETISCLT